MVKVKVKCLYLYWITLFAILAVLSRGQVRAIPHGSSVLLQEETKVPGENLQCSVESNCTTLFSNVTKVTLIR